MKQVHSIADDRNNAKALMILGLCCESVPVLILGSTLLNIDESGLMTIGLFVALGLPLGIVGLGLIITALRKSREARTRGVPVTPDTLVVKIVKAILVTIILVAACFPIWWIISWFMPIE